MNIAILGGSFDPPHRGHTIIAKRLLKLNNFDQVWLMPLFQHPFNKSLSTPKERLEMTKLLEKDKIVVSDIEIKKRTTSYTIDTLNFLRKTNPKDKFYWIIGNDQIKNFTKWKKWNQIIDNFKLIIVPRRGSKKTEEEFKNLREQISSSRNITVINKGKFPPISISSTFIRKRIKNKKPISNMVPKEVERYIIQHKLYE